MMSGAPRSGSLYWLTSVPQTPAISTRSSAASEGTSGRSNSRSSVVDGPTLTAANDFSGRYRMPLLQPGHYEVTAQLSGFQTLVRSGITLTVGEQAVVDGKMSVGNVSESITVEAAAPLVETTTGTISSVVTEQQLSS